MRYRWGVSTDQTIGDNVHTLMWRYRIKQQDMYAAMGVSRSTLAKKLRGQVAWSADDVMVAARLLGVDPGALFVVPEPRAHVARQDPAPQREWAPSDSNRQPTDYARHLYAVAA